MIKQWLQKVLGIEDVKELIYMQNNNILVHDKAVEDLARTYEKDNIRLLEELNKTKALLEVNEELLKAEQKSGMILRDTNFELNKQVEKLTSILEEKEQESLKHSEFVRKTTESLLYQQKKIIKKPTKADLMTEKMNKISDEAKAKLK